MPAAGQSLDQVAAVLAALAYADPSASPEAQLAAMNAALASPDLPTQAPGWSIVWGPATHDEDLVFVARAAGGTTAVAVRGTVVEDWTDLTEDRRVGIQEPLPFTAPAGFEDAAISHGVIECWQFLSQATGMDGETTLLAFLSGLPAGAPVVVTGHSLGGQVATVVAVWLAGALPGNTYLPITFAAPTAGDPAFAAAYDAAFPTAVRYYGELDVIPRLWTAEGVASIKQLFPSPGPRCDLVCHGVVDLGLELVRHVTYQQPANGVELPSQLFRTGPLARFADELIDQHGSVYYMYRLGVSLAGVQVLNPKWTPPGGGATT